MASPKTLRFDENTLEVIKAMKWEDDGKLGKLTGGQLDRTLYVAVNKALEAMGGKWNRSRGGHIFPTDPRPAVEGLLQDGELKVERDGFFETPNTVIERMFELVPPTEPGPLVLEPSAGLGAIANHLTGHNLTLVEKNPQRCEVLRQTFKNVICGDFMEHDCKQNGNCYERIYMNPPFEDLQNTEHIRHAYSLLSPTGVLVSVMGEGAFFRDDRKSSEFRNWLKEVKAHSEKLPEGSFKQSGTGVNARLVVIRRPAND